MKLVQQDLTTAAPADAITSFRGPFMFLSNFYFVPVRWAHVVYPSVENAYHAAKTLDPAERRLIIQCAGPTEAKRIGGDPSLITLRRDWEKLKTSVMEQLLRQKFYPGSNCGNLLAYTADRLLIEGNNWHDVFWGCCTCTSHRGQGDNHLGRLLMLIRDDNR